MFRRAYHPIRQTHSGRLPELLALFGFIREEHYLRLLQAYGTKPIIFDAKAAKPRRPRRIRIREFPPAVTGREPPKRLYEGEELVSPDNLIDLGAVNRSLAAITRMRLLRQQPCEKIANLVLRWLLEDIQHLVAFSAAVRRARTPVLKGATTEAVLEAIQASERRSQWLMRASGP